MYLDDIKSEFYEFLTGKRVFLMVHYDVDSICACKILQLLLRDNNVLYSLAVIRELDDFKDVFRENSENVKYFILINCGGTVDIVDVLEPQDDIVFFVIDSHRPIDLCNIYSTEQVRILSSREEDEDIPEFHDVFKEETDDEDSDNDSEHTDDIDEVLTKRKRQNEENILKRRDKKLWNEKRNRLLFEYSQFTYYAKASAIYMFELAWRLNKDDKDILWLATIGLTEQSLFGKLEDSRYAIELGNLQAHCTRLQNRSNDLDVQTSTKISFEKDLKLVLYRHWSVEDSLRYSMFTACKMKLWSVKGSRKLQELLAHMGLPLIQSKQSFKSMNLQLRKEFYGSLEKIMEKYDLQDMVYPSFTLHYGFGNLYSSSDIVYAMLGILEASVKNQNVEECFNAVLECIPKPKKETLESGFNRAKILTKVIFKTVQSALDTKQIIMAGPFIYYIVQDSNLDWSMFSRLHVLSLLAQFILRAYVTMTKNRKAPTLPLIVSAPYDLDKGSCLVMGIPPVCESSSKNFFGKAFEQAADQINCDILCNFFDSSCIELYARDRIRFLDALTVLLT